MKTQFSVEVAQPIDPIIEKATAQAIDDNIEKKGALLPILHQLQGELKYVPKDAVAMIATALNLSRAEVHGVISFYHTFTEKAQGKYVLEVCRAESCQAVGGRQLEQHIQDLLSVSFGETTKDGMFSLEAVFCLGNCACSPSMRIGDNIYGRVTTDQATLLLDQLKEVAQ